MTCCDVALSCVDPVREAKHERDRALADGEARLKLFESAVKSREAAVTSREREAENMQKHLQARILLFWKTMKLVSSIFCFHKPVCDLILRIRVWGATSTLCSRA